MKILFLTDNFPPERNAPATRTHEHACYWVRNGHEVTVVTCAPNFPEGRVFPGYRNRWRSEEAIDGIRVVRVKTFVTANEGFLLRTLDYLSFMVSSFVAGLFAPRPDVIVATSPQFFTAVSGFLLGFVRRRPFVFEVRDLWPASIEAVGAVKGGTLLRWMEKLELFLYRRASRVVVVTEAFRRNLVGRGIPAEKVSVVINGVDLPRYAPRPRDPELAGSLGIADAFVVGYIGTHGMAHALENVLDAAGMFPPDSDVRFLFAGGGAARDGLEKEADRRKLENVAFLPAQPKERMPAVWSLCDVALVHLKDTPVFETVIPSKIFEAMGMGLPILIASPKGEAARIVLDEGAGMWVPPENPSALADAVRRLRDDADERKGMAERSLAAAGNYSRAQKAADMEAVLRDVAGGRRA